MTGDKNFSLQNEMRKRKTEQLQQVIESKQIERAVSAPQNPKRTTQTTPVVTAAVKPTEAANSTARQTQQASRVRQSPLDQWRSLSIAKRQQVIISVTVLVIAGVLGVTVLLTGVVSGPTANQPTYPSPSNTSVQQVINYLQKTEMHLTNISAAEPDKNWHADQQIAFDIVVNNATTHFVLLSYPSREAQRLDFGTLALNPDYNKMRFIESANMLLLLPENTDNSIQMALDSHLRSLLEAPYYSYLPTPTATVE
jgi:hypothetical protein